jgi:hypothetical protein
MQSLERIVELGGFGDAAGSVDPSEQGIATGADQASDCVGRHCALDDRGGFHA